MIKFEEVENKAARIIHDAGVEAALGVIEARLAYYSARIAKAAGPIEKAYLTVIEDEFVKLRNLVRENCQKPLNMGLANMLAVLGDKTTLSGRSWSGFNLVGDPKSIKEFERLAHEAERARELEARLEVSETKRERLVKALSPFAAACDRLRRFGSPEEQCRLFAGLVPRFELIDDSEGPLRVEHLSRAKEAME